MGNSIYTIDKLSYSNGLRHIHPVEKLFFTITSMAVAIASAGMTAPVAVFCVMACTVIFFTGTGIISYLKLLMIPSVFVLPGVVSVIVEINVNNPDQLYAMTLLFFTATVSSDSLHRGLDLLIKSFASISCFYFFLLSTPAVDFEYILRILRVPLIFREMFMLVYRFIFIVAAISHNIFLSQRLRLGYTSARNRFRSSGGLASGVFVKSFIFGSRSYQALLARGYDGDLKVIDLKYTLSPVNWMCITAIESCFILLVIWFPI